MTDDLEAPESISTREKFRALYEVATFRPRITAGIIVLGVVTAALEGVGLGFILPIIQQAQGDTEPSGLATCSAAVLVTGWSAIATARSISASRSETTAHGETNDRFERPPSTNRPASGIDGGYSFVVIPTAMYCSPANGCASSLKMREGRRGV
jgi:hypothetical protein